ncbi:hypothetical protein QQM79_03420 [Marinobacteraceae bacterium S3BR75-40.1]
MDKYYIISSDDHDAGNPHSPDWPKVIGVSFDAKKVILSEGKGHGLQGARIEFDKFRANEWKDVFISCDAKWLLDEILDNGGISGVDEGAFLKAMPADFRFVEESK